jgi:arylformamidase
MAMPTQRIIDLAHTIVDGLITDPRLPPVQIREHWSRQDSAKRYAPGVSFQISTVETVQNSGTYLDCPWHRFQDAQGVWDFPLERLVNVPAIVVDIRKSIGATGEIDSQFVTSRIARGNAILLCTGLAQRWGTPRYSDGTHPWISERCAESLVEGGVVLYGVDTLNADRFSDPRRPVHSVLLRANIPIIENLCNLESVLGEKDVRLFAAPLKIVGFGSCPVRAFVLFDD